MYKRFTPIQVRLLLLAVRKNGTPSFTHDFSPHSPPSPFWSVAGFLIVASTGFMIKDVRASCLNSPMCAEAAAAGGGFSLRFAPFCVVFAKILSRIECHRLVNY